VEADGRGEVTAVDRRERLSCRLAAPWTGAAAWATLFDDGSLELELFDHSKEAASSLGGDVAWVYRVEAAHIPALLAALGVENESALLNAFVERFAHVHAVRDWLTQQRIPFQEHFDSQA
jgi:hypothetical protein